MIHVSWSHFIEKTRVGDIFFFTPDFLISSCEDVLCILLEIGDKEIIMMSPSSIKEIIITGIEQRSHEESSIFTIEGFIKS